MERISAGGVVEEKGGASKRVLCVAMQLCGSRSQKPYGAESMIVQGQQRNGCGGQRSPHPPSPGGQAERCHGCQFRSLDQ